jgi:hypothetical protein
MMCKCASVARRANFYESLYRSINDNLIASSIMLHCTNRRRVYPNEAVKPFVKFATGGRVVVDDDNDNVIESVIFRIAVATM